MYGFPTSVTTPKVQPAPLMAAIDASMLSMHCWNGLEIVGTASTTFRDSVTPPLRRKRAPKGPKGYTVAQMPRPTRVLAISTTIASCVAPNDALET
jgi:hypothetical protein